MWKGKLLREKWIRSEPQCSFESQENTDLENSECEHFLRSKKLRYLQRYFSIGVFRSLRCQITKMEFLVRIVNG